MINKKMSKIQTYLSILLLCLVSLILLFTTFCLLAIPVNAEMMSSPPTISYVSPTNMTNTFYDRIIVGNRYAGVEVRQSMTMDYYVVDYAYRMSTPGRKYNVYFQVYASRSQMGTITLNNQPCEVYPNFYNDTVTQGGSVLNATLFNVACVNVDPDVNQFQLVLRYNGANWNPNYDNLYGVKNGFFVSSYPSEEQALNNAMSDLATAINNNQTNNTNRIINSVENFGNQLNQNQQQTNQKLDDINRTLSDSSVDGFSINYNNDTNVISGLITMPITLSRAYLSGLNSSCQPYNLGSLYGTPLVLPCINISSWLGGSLFAIVDVLVSGFLIYAIAKMFIRTFNKLTNLNNREVESDLFND